MKKFIVLIVCLMFLFTACSKQKAIIFFNNAPITKENILNNSTEFSAGKKIYYVFMTQQSLKTDSIRVRVLKEDEKANYQATKVFYSNDFWLHKDQIYYYNDYIVINETGYYCMLVYAKNKLDRPLAMAEFKVK